MHNYISREDNIIVLPEGHSFKYVIKTEPFDFWYSTISQTQIISNIKNEFGSNADEIKAVEKSIETIKKIVLELGKENPIKIAFTSIPTQCGDVFELVGLAKIDNNGTSYVFSNDLNYMEYLERKLNV